MMDRLLEIEKKLGITIEMPQICYFCGEEITEKYGRESESLCFHSLDGDHDNWEPENKVPTHHGCHTAFHRTGARVPFVPGVYEKKLISLDGTKAVILPKDWYVGIKRRYGKELIKVYLDVDGDEIKVTPSWGETY